MRNFRVTFSCRRRKMFYHSNTPFSNGKKNDAFNARFCLKQNSNVVKDYQRKNDDATLELPQTKTESVYRLPPHRKQTESIEQSV